MTDTAAAETTPAAETFVCEVCRDEKKMVDRQQLGALDVGNGNRVRQEDCGHHICRTCLGKYVESRVNESRVWNLRCPHDGCVAEVREQDIKKLVDQGHVAAEILTRFVDLRNCNQQAHASELASHLGDFHTSRESEEDFDALLKLYHSVRLCPRCSMVLEKSQGCNSFYCACGFHFDFKSAPRVVGHGMKEKDFQRTVYMARTKGMSLTEAEKYKGDTRDWGRALRMADMAELSLSEAREICQRARGGDESAREAIRSARRQRREAKELAEAREEEATDEEEQVESISIW
eukprot:CAMPEP_0178417516 /NCGR_PEP_ID=MMETSP0689_2-20121128/24613_1 /TAXON_ID=160604 /ORGANISM="Amphidinium massartii, Strain CS-259" /LENGTH=290 /DNA_ID=CAMNT_0020038881 /DNA_START=67 /DNA_END=936 /DNA_ORIENTATION=-